MPSPIERERRSTTFGHFGYVCQRIEKGGVSYIYILVEIPHSGYGPWDSNRQRQWVKSDLDPNIFLSLDEIAISEKYRYLFRPNRQSSVFDWQNESCRLVEYEDQRKLRVQMIDSIPHTGFGPWDSERRLEWIDTYYNPKLFHNLNVQWQKFVTNDAGRESF